MIFTIIGLLIVFFLWGLYLKGYRIERNEKPKLNEDEKLRIDRLNREFGEMVNYNLTKALGRKHE